ncbi:uncharacterized protein LOC119685142 [Teleopsis dalmanni]|uniref:uncharacterized protein LOC119685142 n=1 Tax=Teleopsis dalmanni TaxID=139649 RepID=UPI0018CE5085|nr:uncharacterized protein LOC119685142 [Teleopsis dalmanni]XP_037955279.1 uncharacterized protein LOC119685142 [Teleopsis dalmanni]
MPPKIHELIREALCVIEAPTKAEDIAKYIAGKSKNKYSTVLKNVKTALKDGIRDTEILTYRDHYYLLETTEKCMRKILEEDNSDDFSTDESEYIQTENVPLHRKSEESSNINTDTATCTETEIKFCTCDRKDSSESLKSILKHSTKSNEQKRKLSYKRMNANNRKNIPKPNAKKKTKSVRFSKVCNVRDKQRQQINKKDVTNKSFEYCMCSSSEETLDDKSVLSVKEKLPSIEAKTPISHNPSNDSLGFWNEICLLVNRCLITSSSMSQSENISEDVQVSEQCDEESLHCIIDSDESICNCSKFNFQPSKNLNLNNTKNADPSIINKSKINDKIESKVISVSYKIDNKVVCGGVLKRSSSNIATVSNNTAATTNLQMEMSDLCKDEPNLNAKINNDVPIIKTGSKRKSSSISNNIEDREDTCKDDEWPASRARIEKSFKSSREPGVGSHSKH